MSEQRPSIASFPMLRTILDGTKPDPMRTLLLLLASATTGLCSANRLQVVVYTSDQHIVQYVCSDRLALNPERAFRNVVVAAGRVSWHPTGGCAPYELLDNHRDELGNVCITVRDAKGDIAIGCGLIATFYQTVNVPCPAQPVPAITHHSGPPTADHRLREDSKSSPICPREPERVRPREPVRARPREVNVGPQGRPTAARHTGVGVTNGGGGTRQERKR